MERLVPAPAQYNQTQLKVIKNRKLVLDCQSCESTVAIEERRALLMMDAHNAADKDRMAPCVNFF